MMTHGLSEPGGRWKRAFRSAWGAGGGLHFTYFLFFLFFFFLCFSKELFSFFVSIPPLVVLRAFHLVELTEGGQVLESLSGGQIGQVLCCQLLEWLGLAVKPMLCETTDNDRARR